MTITHSPAVTSARAAQCHDPVFQAFWLLRIGFTVALLIGELAFPGAEAGERAKAAVLVGSLIAAVLAAVLLRRRNGIYRRLYEEETLDADTDGIPDIYQRTAEPGAGR